MLRRARFCHSILSVCPSVTFRYRDHIGWKPSKIISRPNSLRAVNFKFVYAHSWDWSEQNSIYNVGELAVGVGRSHGLPTIAREHVFLVQNRNATDRCNRPYWILLFDVESQIFTKQETLCSVEHGVCPILLTLSDYDLTDSTARQFCCSQPHWAPNPPAAAAVFCQLSDFDERLTCNFKILGTKL